MLFQMVKLMLKSEIANHDIAKFVKLCANFEKTVQSTCAKFFYIAKYLLEKWITSLLKNI